MPMSRAQFDALADDDARNATIMRALGWRPPAQREDDDFDEWTRDGFASAGLIGYFTGGDIRPFDNWALLAEVWRALPRDCRYDWTLSEDHNFWSASGYTPSLGEQGAVYEDGLSPHRAACYALVDAGLVPHAE